MNSPPIPRFPAGATRRACLGWLGASLVPAARGQAAGGAPANMTANAPAITANAPAQVRFSGDFSDATRSEAGQWVTRSAQAIVDYFGRFPAPQAVLTVVATGGSGVRSGLTFDGPPPGVRVTVGQDTTRERFLTDWVLVHEMVHLAIAQLPQRHNWFHEGTATYVEIMARARAGLTSREYAWDQLMRNLHHGQPQPGEGGLDGTRRWGRTYWGGAMFCLLADVDIRKRTANRLGLQDALAGLVRAGSHYGQHWSMERTLQAADAAVGVPALMTLYAGMKDTAVTVDLPALWAELGLRSGTDGPLQLLAHAPGAATRRAILPE